MERDFYQTLRKIQKAERNKKSTLSRVGDDFYKKMYSYIKELEHSIQNNPFSNEEHNLLKNSQIIATEICQSREQKISNFAILNIQRSYLLFAKGRPQFDVVDTTPLNLTPEEETLYYALMDNLKEHRSRISLDKFAEETPGDMYPDSEEDDGEHYSNDDSDEDSNSSEGQDDDVTIFSADDGDDYDYSNEDPYVFSAGSDSSQDDQFDEVSERFNQIKNAKVVDDEKYEPIEKQIANQKISRAKEDEAFNSSFQVNGGVDSQADNEGISQDIGSSSKADEGIGQGVGSSSKTDDFIPPFSEEDSFPSIDPFAQEEEFNFPNPFDEQFSNQNIIENNHDDDFKRVNDDLDRINADLDKLSSEIPSGKKEKVEKITVKINEEISSIIGVDEKIYGPFSPEDVVILPKLNADILIDNNKAKLVDI